MELLNVLLNKRTDFLISVAAMRLAIHTQLFYTTKLLPLRGFKRCVWNIPAWRKLRKYGRIIWFLTAISRIAATDNCIIKWEIILFQVLVSHDFLWIIIKIKNHDTFASWFLNVFPFQSFSFYSTLPPRSERCSVLSGFALSFSFLSRFW